MSEVQVDQRSDEWHALRCGRITGGAVSNIIAKTKSGPAASRKNYMAELVAEILSGQPAENFVTWQMQRGIDLEADARAEYELLTGRTVREVGFCIHEELDFYGGSPDGLVDDDGGIEIKCPNTATHIAFLQTGKIHNDYLVQMQSYMEITNREWWDFVSYDPRISEPSLYLAIKRVRRDRDWWDEVKPQLVQFYNEVLATVEGLKKLQGKGYVAHPES